MSVKDWHCDSCRNPSSTLQTVGGLLLCRHCYCQVVGELEQRRTIPEGCEMRFLFYWWLRLTGRISEFSCA